MAKVTKEFQFATRVTINGSGKPVFIGEATITGICELFPAACGNGPTFKPRVTRVHFLPLCGPMIDATEIIMAFGGDAMNNQSINDAVYAHCFKLYDQHFNPSPERTPGMHISKEDRADELREREYENQFAEPINHEIES